jgi:ABC-type phosphate transport system substrate-binding protein
VKKSIISIAVIAALMSVAAHAEMVVVVNPKNPAGSMTPEQVANVFLGKDTRLKPVENPMGAPGKSEFYQKVLNKDVTQVKAIWSRLIFTGDAALPKEVSGDAEAVKQVAGDENAIAYVDKGAVDGSVKTVLTVN